MTVDVRTRAGDYVALAKPRLNVLVVASTVAGLFVLSAPGQAPGPTVRYVLPLAFVVAASLGLLVSALQRRSTDCTRSTSSRGENGLVT